MSAKTKLILEASQQVCEVKRQQRKTPVMPSLTSSMKNRMRLNDKQRKRTRRKTIEVRSLYIRDRDIHSIIKNKRGLRDFEKYLTANVKTLLP